MAGLQLLFSYHEHDRCVKHVKKHVEPDLYITVIHSNNDLFVEDGVPLIRKWEVVLYKGKAKNIKLQLSER